MSTGNTSEAAQAPANAEELAAEIKETREQLGNAVQQLTAKTDVKRFVSEEAGHQVERLRAGANQARAQLAAHPDQQRKVALAATGVFAVIAAVLLYQWRSHR
jgi:hypothetical protein